MPPKRTSRTRTRNSANVGIEDTVRNRSRSPVMPIQSSNIGSDRFDMENPNNWTVPQLRRKIEEQGTKVPLTFKKAALIQLYDMNKEQRQSEGSLNAPFTSDADRIVQDIPR